MNRKDCLACVVLVDSSLGLLATEVRAVPARPFRNYIRSIPIIRVVSPPTYDGSVCLRGYTSRTRNVLQHKTHSVHFLHFVRRAKLLTLLPFTSSPFTSIISSRLTRKPLARRLYSYVMTKSVPRCFPKSLLVSIKAKSTVSKKSNPKMEPCFLNLSALEQALMGYLGKLYWLGFKGPVNVVSVAQECGYKNCESKGFRAARIKLRNAGLIQITCSTVQLTCSGVASLPKDPRPPPETNWDFHDIVKHHFENDEKISRLIDVLAHGGCLANPIAASLLGYKNAESRGFRRAKNALKELHFLDGTKMLCLTNSMFPFGRPEVIIV